MCSTASRLGAGPSLPPPPNSRLRNPMTSPRSLARRICGDGAPVPQGSADAAPPRQPACRLGPWLASAGAWWRLSPRRSGSAVTLHVRVRLLGFVTCARRIRLCICSSYGSPDLGSDVRGNKSLVQFCSCACAPPGSGVSSAARRSRRRDGRAGRARPAAPGRCPGRSGHRSGRRWRAVLIVASEAGSRWPLRRGSPAPGRAADPGATCAVTNSVTQRRS